MPATGSTASHDKLEIFAAVLLALAAVATAWASYQATRWNGEQVKASSRTNALRIEASRAESLAESQTQIDVATFIQWIDATATDESDLADFYEARFRPEFKPAFEAWLATDPLSDADAPPTPFAMDEYRPAARADTAELDRRSAASAEQVSRYIQRAANYVLGVVLFAVALFFAGISTRLDRAGLRAGVLAVGWLLFVLTATWLATFPIIVDV